MTTRSNTPEFTTQAKKLVWELTNSKSDVFRRAYIRKIFLFVHFCEEGAFAKRVACANAGAIQALLRVVIDASDPAGYDTKARALRTLGQMCCFDDYVSSKTATSPELLQAIKPIFNHPIPQLWADACYLINVVAADSWTSHPILQQFVPNCTSLIASTTTTVTRQTKANCIRFLGQLASNPANSDFLLDPRFDVLPLLVDAMKSLSVDRACTSAAVAVANLAGHKSQFLDQTQTRELMKILANAWLRALNGQDFPPGSNIFYDDWKLMVGISKLLANPQNCIMLRNEGIVPLIEISLRKPNAHPKLTTHALMSLWHLAEE